MTPLSPIIKELINSLENDSKYTTGPDIKVSEAGSSAGLIYERLRNVIDYKDEHLLRRNAIERILRRRLVLNHTNEMGEALVKELIWAGYLPNDFIKLSVAEKINKVVGKYKLLLDTRVDKIRQSDISNWILGVMSAEVDDVLVPHLSEEVLNRAMFRLMAEKIRLDEGLSEEDRNVQIYLGVRRSLFKEDLPTLRYKLLLIYVPEWANGSEKIVSKFLESFPKLYLEWERQLRNPISIRLAKFFQPFTPPFLILRDLLIDKGNFETLISNEEEFDYQIDRTCEKRYSLVRNRLGRSIFRSTIYIFLTKTLFAYLLEMPADLYLYGKVHFLPLSINVLFPPILMYLVGSSIKVPGRENTEKIKIMIKDIVYGSSQSSTLLTNKFEVRSKALGKVFGVLYAIGFLISFGIIVYLLKMLTFGPASITIFLFFLSVVSFFAYRIRLTAREYMVTEQREGITSSLIDFFTIPFLQMGQWLSSEFAKINVFLFVFDFIIEAPFKAFIEIADEWIRFLKQKKEEIV